MGTQTKKQTPRIPTANPHASLIGPQLSFEEPDLAFAWLESIADLINVAVTSTNDLDDETIHNAAWLMEEIAKGDRACLRREREARREGR